MRAQLRSQLARVPQLAQVLAFHEQAMLVQRQIGFFAGLLPPAENDLYRIVVGDHCRQAAVGDSLQKLGVFVMEA